MRIVGPITRRCLLKTAAIADAGSAAGLPLRRLAYAQPPTPVKFTLPWVAEGSSLFTSVAKEMGFLDKHGLDVSIARGSAAAEAIGTGHFDSSMRGSRPFFRWSRGCRSLRSALVRMTRQWASACSKTGRSSHPRKLEGRQRDWPRRMAAPPASVHRTDAVRLLPVWPTRLAAGAAAPRGVQRDSAAARRCRRRRYLWPHAATRPRPSLRRQCDDVQVPIPIFH